MRLYAVEAYAETYSTDNKSGTIVSGGKRSNSQECESRRRSTLRSLAPHISCQEGRTVVLYPYQGRCRLVTYHAGNGKTSVTRSRSCRLVPISINVCWLSCRQPPSDPAWVLLAKR
jgi:hypothetical protein